MIARARQHNDNRRAGRHGVNKTERAMVERLARPAVEPVDLAGMLTDAGVDRLAMCPDWGEVPQPVLPADVVAAANAGGVWRKPHAGEVHRLHVAWHRRCSEERMSDGHGQ